MKKDKKTMKNIDDLISSTVKESKNVGWDFEKQENFYSSKELDHWTNSDLGKYADFKYLQTFKEKLNPGRAYLSIIIARVKKEYFILFNEKPSNKTLKNYIDFFFDEEVNILLMSKENKFTLSMLTWESCIKKFVEKKKLIDSIKKEKNTIDDLLSTVTVKGKCSLPSFEEISEKEKIGLQSVLLSFGIVCCINYLLNKGIKYEEISQKLKNTIERICKNNVLYWKNIKQRTEQYNPYSKEILEYTKFDLFIKEVSFNNKDQIKVEKQ